MTIVSSLYSRLPTSLKVRGVLGIAGFDSAELKAMDSLIASVAGTPVMQFVLGENVNSVSALVDLGLKVAESDPAKTERITAMLPALKPYLSSDAGRVQAATFLVKLIDSLGENKVVAYQLLTKLMKADLFASQNFATVHDFLANGLIPIAANVIPTSAKPHKEHSCSFCGYVEGTSNEIS